MATKKEPEDDLESCLASPPPPKLLSRMTSARSLSPNLEGRRAQVAAVASP